MGLGWYGGKQPRKGGGGLVDQVAVSTASGGGTRPEPSGERLVEGPRTVDAVQLVRPAASGLTPAGRFKLG